MSARPDRADLIEGGWRELRRSALPATAPEIQVREMRRAFYAGCAHIMGIAFGLGDDAVPEDRGIAVLEQITEEIRRYGEDLKNGRA